MYPSVPKELKYAFEDSTLPDGTHIPKGACAIFFPWVMGRHPALWDNPEEFDPTRFLNTPKPSPFKYTGKVVQHKSKRANKFPQFTCTAFQGGPRICLGQNMALLEAKCVLARLLLSFDFSLAVDKTAITYKDSLTLPMRNGLPMHVKALTSSS